MTYAEALVVMEPGSAVFQKVRVAVLVSCEAIRVEAVGTTNHAARVVWAKKTFADPDAMAPAMTRAVVVQNMGITQAAALAASDANVQSACNSAVDSLA